MDLTLHAPHSVADWRVMIHPLSLFSLFLICLSFSQCASGQRNGKAIVHENGYIQESPHPKGYPEPGPFNAVTKKSYPAYRAAVTATNGANSGFWTLFKHIKSKDIAMTSPVEMKMGEADDGNLEMQEMSFLYRNPEQGAAGADGKKVEVVNLPKIEVLSYAWQGPRSDKLVADAKARLLAEAKKQNLKYTGFRLLGYNSPFIADKRKTHELQLMLK